MNCPEWEEAIALYAGGDLEAATGRDVERHLAECPGCQLFASGLAEALECVRTAHHEAIAPAHYTALRARVLAAVDRDRRRWRWLWIPAAAAVAGIALVAGGLRMQTPELLPVALRNAPPAEAWQFPPARPAPTDAAPRVALARRTRSKPLPRREQVVVKVETDNPDVVILWIAETKGEN